MNDPIFKSSNARGLPGGGMLKFRVDRRIIINIKVSHSHNLLSVQITGFHKKGNFNADLFLDLFANLYCEDLQTLN